MRRLLPRNGVALLALVALIFAATPPAPAFQPVTESQMYEIPLPEFYPLGESDAAFAADERSISQSLTSRYGGNWRVFSFNPQANTPRYVYGSGAKLAGAIGSPQTVEQLARQVIEDNPGLFRADPLNLELSATPHARGKWVAHFQQTYHGLEVWQGKALVAFSDDGRLLLMSSDYYSDIDLDPVPGLSASDAVQIACGDLPFDPAVDKVEGTPELMVLPYPLSETEVEHHLVYRVRVRTSDPLGIWVTHLDARSGQILWRYNAICLEYLGDTTASVQEDTYCNGATDQAVHYLRLNISGIGTVITDTHGTWSIAGTGGARTVSGDLYGPYIDMNNYGGAEANYSGTAQEDVPLTVVWDNGNSRQDERDTFDAINDIHDFFELFAPGFGYTNQRISAYVNRTDGYCPGNAWWDGTINFCAEGGGYANTGEIQGVAHHEFGHGVQDAILGWQGDQGLGEGNSDILSVLMSHEPIIGLGFYLGNCTSGIRTADNTLVYPDDVIGQQIHYAGQVICGFHWDSQLLLESLYGQEAGTILAADNWHWGRVLLQPTTQPDQVYATFFADDDDGNMDNGTPHHWAYCEAAENHGFECPEILVGVLFSHTPLEDTIDTTNPYVVGATIWSTEGGLDPSTVKIVWRRNEGSWNEVLMTHLGGDNYQGEIPAQNHGKIDYYLYAEDLVGTVGSLPVTAPDAYFRFLVATSIDPLEETGGWTAGDVDDDATTGLWVRADPVGTTYSGNVVQPEDDHTIAGTECWITGNGSVGGAAGEQDVDGGKTTLFSPVYDLSTYEEVTVRYWKWYTNNRGYNPNEDYWDVLVSNNGGGSWTTVEHTTSSTNAWVAFTFDLADYFAAPGQMQLKFIAQDEGAGGSLVEAGIDDFVLVAISGVSGVEDGDLAVRFVTDLAQNHPNPFNPRTEISFSLEKAGPVSLKVFDARGRLMARLVDGDLPAGPQRVAWDGARDDGRPVASGVYFYQLEADNQVFSKRMLLLK